MNPKKPNKENPSELCDEPSEDLDWGPEDEDLTDPRLRAEYTKRKRESLSRLTDDMSEDEVWESDCEYLGDYVRSGPKRKDPRIPSNPKISMKDERGSIVDAGSVIVREFLAYCGLKKSIDGTRSKLEEGEHPFEPVVSDHEIDFKDNLHTGYEPYIPKKEFIRDHYLRASLRSQIRELSLRDRRSPIVDGSKDMDIAAGVASRLIPLVLDCFHLYAQVRGLTEEEERSLILSDMVVRSGDPTRIELILFGKITGRWEAQRYRLFHNFIENIARLWNWLMKDESDPGFEYPEEERIRRLYKEGKLTLADLLDKQDPVTRWPSKDDPNEFGGKFNYVPRFTDPQIPTLCQVCGTPVFQRSNDPDSASPSTICSEKCRKKRNKRSKW